MNEQTPKPPARLLGLAAIILVWVVSLTLAIAVAAEWYMGAAKHLGFAPHYARIDAAYAPFRVQHTNPFYLFFFPLEPARRVAMGSDICSIGPEGFRGAGPEAAAGKRLAFFLGGSAAFGYAASSNETTITGYLNATQNEYHFVNAGVPSWNSTQEMYRLVHQIIAHEPDLVIAYDGANDAAILNRYNRWGLTYPPGTPETFEVLYEMTDDLRSGGRWLQLHKSIFPRLTHQLRRIQWKARTDGSGPPDETIEKAATAYLHNLRVMNDITRSRGGRFIGIFQPIRSLHRGVPAEHRNAERLPVYRKFHALATASNGFPGSYHDFARYFDTIYTQVPSIDIDAGEDVDAETIFLDDVHLFDEGNRLIAEAIRKVI